MVSLDDGWLDHTSPRDIVKAIDGFRAGEVSIRTCLDQVLTLIHRLPDQENDRIGELEDLWGELEIIYALGSADGRGRYTGPETEATHDFLDQMEAVLVAIAKTP